MREIKINLLLQAEETATDKLELARLYYLRSVINSGSYNVSGDEIAEEFLADQWLYLLS